jgi:hypothetical protein
MPIETVTMTAMQTTGTGREEIKQQARQWRWALSVGLVAGILLAAAQVRADDCDDTVRMDGLFSKARRDCPFSYYAFRFQQQSQLCRDKKGAAEWQRLFGVGVSTFDAQAARHGRQALCDKLARDFPMTVKY